MEIKTHSAHPTSMAERIAKRLRNSGDAKNADEVVQKGEGPTRTFHNLHNHGSACQHGKPHPGEGDIHGNKRESIRTQSRDKHAQISALKSYEIWNTLALRACFVTSRCETPGHHKALAQRE